MDSKTHERAITSGLNGGVVITPTKGYIATGDDKLSMMICVQDTTFSSLSINLKYPDGTVPTDADVAAFGAFSAGFIIPGDVTKVTISSGLVFGYR